MTKDEALKLALEALKSCYDVDSWPADGSTIQDEAIAKCEEALAQSAKEPVAWAIYDKRGGSKSLHWNENHSPEGDSTMFDAEPLYRNV
jgi:hypothetical protein